MRRFTGTAAQLALLLGIGPVLLGAAPPQKPPYEDDTAVAQSKSIRIGNFLVTAPGGIAFIVQDAAAFVVDTGAPYSADTAAPDDSFHQVKFTTQGAKVAFEWGRTGDAVVARLTSDKPVTLPLHLSAGWPGFVTRYTPAPNGVMGEASVQGHPVTWQLVTLPRPVQTSVTDVTVAVAPGAPLRFVAGLGQLPTFGQVNSLLTRAQSQYQARRPAAAGDGGDFVGAIADNMNNSRIYSSDNHRLAHSVSRGWANGNPNNAPYFCWDSFFTADLACLDDPQTARETVRAILSCQTSEGLVPNFGHWQFGSTRASDDRSQPPVGALCVWKMQQRWPDRAFLAEVYPKLVRWHRWWPTARDGNRDGLLEWGSATGDFQNAQYETGWDDNRHFAGAHMVGHTMNADAVDLNALWSMDAEYLAYIADALGRKADAQTFRAEHAAINQRINDRLWNDELGVYCSRLWDEDGKPGAFLTRLTPMNFYPLIAGVPDQARAKRVLSVLTDPHKFWGTWLLPTLAYDDPDYHEQEYWRGDIWGPVNYLVFQGLERYASPTQRTDFARKSVTLFMGEWTRKGVCGENYLSTDGTQNRDPHYTWGALLPLIGVENICDVGPNGALRLNGSQTQTLYLTHIPYGGRLYDLQTRPGQAELRLNGKVILKAIGRIVELPVPKTATKGKGNVK